MKRKHHGLVSSVIIAVTVSFSACGDKQEAPPPKTTVDQLAPRYESTLTDGIVFNRPGYPTFLIDVVGVSNQEPWGRWTDGPTVKFRFNKPLPKKFVLEIQANAVGPNEGKPVKIRVGAIERSIIIKNEPSYAVYAVTFDDVSAADTIEITPPNPILPRELDPNNKDERKLGLGLAKLRVKTAD